MNPPVKGPVVTRHRLDAETYALVSRRTGATVATVLYSVETDTWDWRLEATAKAPPRSALKPKRIGSEKTLTEAQAMVDYLTKRHNLDGNGG